MTVRVNKSWQQRASAQIDNFSLIAHQRHYFVSGADGLDQLAFGRQRFSHCIIGIHGQDVAINKHLMRWRLRSTQGDFHQHPYTKHQREQHSENCFPIHKKSTGLIRLFYHRAGTRE